MDTMDTKDTKKDNIQLIQKLLPEPPKKEAAKVDYREIGKLI
jgi:sulfur relay (sulfurtransferase) DsrC/TusE family protein